MIVVRGPPHPSLLYRYRAQASPEKLSMAGLANEPAALVAALGGDFGDVVHSADALARATDMAKTGATFSSLMLRHRICFFSRWISIFAVLQDGLLRLYYGPDEKSAFRTIQIKDCDCQVGEREECKTDNYCFRLSHNSGTATFCARSSKELLLWLQALQSAGCRYEEEKPSLAHITSLFELRANLLSGEPVELSKYRGCVCLVVNAASK